MINDPFTLPCGQTLKNRLVKSAMTERLSNVKLEPTNDHEHLYRCWSKSGAGLLITGNVMIDRVHLESESNVTFDNEAMLPKLQRWAQASQEFGNQTWVQISHAGRQTNRFSTQHPLAPSAVQLKKMALFGTPKAMTEAQIQEVIHGFSKAAMIAKAAGFSGVQIHSAHGYLLSQFLSPLTNQRTDQWGGSLENRSRLLKMILSTVREVVGADFPVSVKLNSADFQRGGFTEDESLEVVKMLDALQIDLLEISGGTYEKVAFFILNEEQNEMRKSTHQREAYFIDFARKAREISKIPLLITGGFRSRAFCDQVLKNGEVDFIGMARPFLTNLGDIPDFLNNDTTQMQNLVLRTGLKALDDSAEAGYYAYQLIRLAKDKELAKSLHPMWCSSFLIWHEMSKAFVKKFRS